MKVWACKCRWAGCLRRQTGTPKGSGKHYGGRHRKVIRWIETTLLKAVDARCFDRGSLRNEDVVNLSSFGQTLEGVAGPNVMRIGMDHPKRVEHLDWSRLNAFASRQGNGLALQITNRWIVFCRIEIPHQDERSIRFAPFVNSFGNQSHGLLSRLLGNVIKVSIENVERAITRLVAKQGPGADTNHLVPPVFGTRDLRGVGQPEGAMIDEIDSIFTKENGAGLSFLGAIITTDTDALVGTERRFEIPDLGKKGFLHADNVGIQMPNRIRDTSLPRIPVVDALVPGGEVADVEAHDLEAQVVGDWGVCCLAWREQADGQKKDGSQLHDGIGVYFCDRGRGIEFRKP
jgi:hypothetical protein